MVLFLFSITSQAYSFDICEEGRKGLTETNAVYTEYFNSYIKRHNAAGSVKVRDVYPTGRSYEYLLKLDCGNDVILFATSTSGFLKDVKVGQEVSFSCEVKSWEKDFYQNSDKYHVKITLDDCRIRF